MDFYKISLSFETWIMKLGNKQKLTKQNIYTLSFEAWIIKL